MNSMIDIRKEGNSVLAYLPFNPRTEFDAPKGAINKSLVSGRTPEDMEYRKTVRQELFPRIILELFQDKG